MSLVGVGGGVFVATLGGLWWTCRFGTLGSWVRIGIEVSLIVFAVSGVGNVFGSFA